MKKKHIYIPIEILVREINPKIIFSYEAALKNYRVYIGTKTGINKLIQKKKNSMKAGIFFYKSQIIMNRPYANDIKSTCEKFIVLDEELGAGVSNIKSTLERRGRNLGEIDNFFVIGKCMYKNLINFDPYFKKIASITGWLKYDVYIKKNIQLFNSEANDIKKKFGKFYLFSSNYGALSSLGLKIRLKNDKNLSKLKFSKKKDNDFFTFKQSIKDFNYLKKHLFKFLKLNPNFKLIIRPHPGDQLYTDWNIFKKFKNVKVIIEGDIVPWIISSKGLIHRGCSTAIDAFFLKKPAYFLKPKRKLLSSEKNLIYKISKKIKNFNELKKYNYVGNLKKNDLISNEIYFGNKTTSEKILDALKEYRITKENPIKFTIFQNFINYFLPFIGNIKHKIKSFLLNTKHSKDQKIHKFITKKGLKKKIFDLNKSKQKIKIIERTKDVFEIEKV